MKKADNFDSSKWLVENKITIQSRLNEEDEYNDSEGKKIDYHPLEIDGINFYAYQTYSSQFKKSRFGKEKNAIEFQTVTIPGDDKSYRLNNLQKKILISYLEQNNIPFIISTNNMIQVPLTYVKYKYP